MQYQTPALTRSLLQQLDQLKARIDNIETNYQTTAATNNSKQTQNNEKLTPDHYAIYLRDSQGCSRNQKRAIRQSLLKDFYKYRSITKTQERLSE